LCAQTGQLACLNQSLIKSVDASLHVQPAGFHSFKSSGLWTSVKHDSGKRTRRPRVCSSILEAQRSRAAPVTTPSKLPDFPETQNPAEALIQHLETLPSSDDINGESSVSDSADRLFLWESVPKLGTCSELLQVLFCSLEFLFLRCKTRAWIKMNGKANQLSFLLRYCVQLKRRHSVCTS
jgi:hypothetical protein